MCTPPPHPSAPPRLSVIRRNPLKDTVSVVSTTPTGTPTPKKTTQQRKYGLLSTFSGPKIGFPEKTTTENASQSTRANPLDTPRPPATPGIQHLFHRLALDVLGGVSPGGRRLGVRVHDASRRWLKPPNRLAPKNHPNQSNFS